MTTTWTDQEKNPIDFLLLESGDFLLLESGDLIILQQTGLSASSITNVVKH